MFVMFKKQAKIVKHKIITILSTACTYKIVQISVIWHRIRNISRNSYALVRNKQFLVLHSELAIMIKAFKHNSLFRCSSE